MSSTSTTTQVAWNYAGRAVDLTLTYITSIVIARALGVEQYGVLAGAISIAQLLLATASGGLEPALLQRLSALDAAGVPRQAAFLLRRALLLRLGLLVFVSVAAVIVAVFVAGPVSMVAIAAYVIPRSLAAVCGASLIAVRGIRPWAVATAIVRILELSLAIGMVSGGGMTPTDVVTLFACTGVLHLVLLLPWLPWRGGTEATPVRPFLVFALTFWANVGLEYMLGRYGDLFLLSALLRERGEPARYDAAYSLMQAASFVFTLGFSGIILSALARKAATDPEGARAGYGLAVRVVSLLQIPVFGFLVFNAGPVVHALYGAEFSGAASLLRGMALFRIAGRLYGGGENADYLLALDRPRAVLECSIGTAIANAGLDILLIPRVGAWGAVVGSGVATVLASMITFRGIRREQPITLNVRPWLLITVSALVPSFLVFVLPLGGPWTKFLLGGAMSMVGTIALLRILRPLPASDRRWSGTGGSWTRRGMGAVLALAAQRESQPS